MEERLTEIYCMSLPITEELVNSTLTITDYDTKCIDLHLSTPMKLPFGVIKDRPSAWVTLHHKDLSGHGEGATLPEAVFTDDSGHNIASNTASIAASLVTDSITLEGALASIKAFEFSDGGYYPTARLAVEMAALDLWARTHNTTVKQLIGLPASTVDVPYGFSIGADDEAGIWDQAEKAIGQNATKIKLKISPPIHRVVVGALQSLKHEFPRIEFMVDANGTYDPVNASHLEGLCELDELGLTMIEEPVSRTGPLRGLSAVRELRERLHDLRTPLCLDDCLKDASDCATSLTEQLAQIVNIKPGRIGSFVTSLQLVDWVQKNGGQVMVGGMLEATPGRCMTTLLGAYCIERGFTIPGDLSLAQERLTNDLVPRSKQLQMNEFGKIVLPTGLGWGF